MNTKEQLPEIVLGDGSPADSTRLSKMVSKGVLRPIFSKVYTSNLEEPLEKVVLRNAHKIAEHIIPGAVLSHVTAFEGGMPKFSTLVLTSPSASTRNIQLPGLVLKIYKGPGPLPDDNPHIGGLRISSLPRSCLENLQISKPRDGFSKTAGKEAVEKKLESLCAIRGENELRELRESARIASAKLGMESQFKTLDQIIGELLGTRPVASLSTEAGKARAGGSPYDTGRVEILDTLMGFLAKQTIPETPDPLILADESVWENRAFFEAYFSNYIEGTKFALDEARRVVFENADVGRPQDSHDIVGTFDLAKGVVDFHSDDPLQFLATLRRTHALLMSARPEIRPGEFKERNNQAGSTLFVDKDLVMGTMIQALERLVALSNPLAKAIYLMFSLTEIHPFEDGNGRIARLVMNDQLSLMGWSRVIIPTSRRVDYVQALKALSNGKPEPIYRLITRQIEETASIDFSSIETAAAMYQDANAYEEYTERFDIG